MKVILKETYEDVSEWAAEFICNRINKHSCSPNNYFVLGLPTGSTPIGTYNKLIEYHKKGLVSFKYVKTFNMDEYVGLAHDHPQSYNAFMWQHLFSHVDIEQENVHILDGACEDLEAECKKFELKMEEAGGVDLFIGGVGQDGHLAFNEPGSSLTSRTRVKKLARETIEANSRFFDGDVTKVPKKALTVGVGTVMSAKQVMILVSGENKSLALHKAVECGVNHMWTVSVLQNHRDVIFVCDEPATMELKVKTVKYFKDLM